MSLIRLKRCLPATLIFPRSGDEGLLAQILRLLEQHLAVADDRVERRPELVAHIGQELRFHPIGGLGLLLCGLELGLLQSARRGGLLEYAEGARHLSELIPASQCRDDDAMISSGKLPHGFDHRGNRPDQGARTPIAESECGEAHQPAEQDELPLELGDACKCRIGGNCGMEGPILACGISGGRTYAAVKIGSAGYLDPVHSALSGKGLFQR